MFVFRGSQTVVRLSDNGDKEVTMVTLLPVNKSIKAFTKARNMSETND